MKRKFIFFNLVFVAMPKISYIRNILKTRNCMNHVYIVIFDMFFQISSSLYFYKEMKPLIWIMIVL